MVGGPASCVVCCCGWTAAFLDSRILHFAVGWGCGWRGTAIGERSAVFPERDRGVEFPGDGMGADVRWTDNRNWFAGFSLFGRILRRGGERSEILSSSACIRGRDVGRGSGGSCDPGFSFLGADEYQLVFPDRFPAQGVHVKVECTAGLVGDG